MITFDWVAQCPLMKTGIDRPLNVLDTHIGEDMLLRGYDLSTEQIAAGDTIAITLWWESLHNQSMSAVSCFTSAIAQTNGSSMPTAHLPMVDDQPLCGIQVK